MTLGAVGAGVDVEGDKGGGGAAVIGVLRVALEESVSALSAPTLLAEGEVADALAALDAVTTRSHALMVALPSTRRT